MVPGKELTIRCMDTGTYTRSVLTEGQGGTFIEMEAGNDPSNLGVRMQVAMAGQRLFRRWVEHALEKLSAAAVATRTRQWAILDSNQGPLPYQRSALTD